MPTIVIDNRAVEVEEGATILDAARKLGIKIPTLCYREGLPANTSCLVCVVRINGAERLVPSCGTVAREGMVVESETPAVHEARRMALELLLGDHLGDCLGPCQLGCPAGMDIPHMLRAVMAGEMSLAANIARERLVLPAALGRVCPAPCERVCRRGQLDEAIAIRALHRMLGDAELTAGHGRTQACAGTQTQRTAGEGERRQGRAVAIVGAGPAGIAAAVQLRRAGYGVTLLDDHEQPGGMLRHPELAQKLHPELLDAEIEMALGTTTAGGDVAPPLHVRCSERVTAEGLEELQREFGAVLIATGEMGLTSAAALGLPMSGRGLAADRETQMTERPGVFVAGAALSPGRMAVRAIASGNRAAEGICRYLAGEVVAANAREFNVSMGRLSEDDLWAFVQGAKPGPRAVPSRGELLGYSEAEAMGEAERCLHCDCRALEDCGLRQYAIEYEADPKCEGCERRQFARDVTHPHVIYEPGKCIDCGLCIQIAERAGEELGLTFVGRGFEVRMAAPFGTGMAWALRRVARECAAACPTGALAVRH